jgi:hypothetical protein
VEQAAEEVASPDLQRIDGGCPRRIGCDGVIRRSQVECSVRPLHLIDETRAWQETLAQNAVLPNGSGRLAHR